MSMAGPAAASAVTSTSVWAGPLPWAAAWAPASARQAEGTRIVTTGPGDSPAPAGAVCTEPTGAACVVRRNTEIQAARSRPLPSGSDYPGEPVFRLADDIEQVLVG